MQARSALFDLYGDYLRPRGGRAPVAALVKLLAPLGIAPPAVRTAVSRMVRQGWLHPLRLSSGPGYLITPKAARRLDEAAARIYRTGQGQLGRPVRPAGARGPGRPPGPAAARRQPDLPRLRHARRAHLGRHPARRRTSTGCSTEAGVRLRAVHRQPRRRHRRRRWRWSAAPGTSPRSAAAYERFVAEQTPAARRGHRPQRRRGGVRGPVPARARVAYVPVPGPAAAPGAAARPLARHRARPAFFDRHAARLRPAADRYVDRCLDAHRVVRPKGS